MLLIPESTFENIYDGFGNFNVYGDIRKFHPSGFLRDLFVNYWYWRVIPIYPKSHTSIISTVLLTYGINNDVKIYNDILKICRVVINNMTKILSFPICYITPLISYNFFIKNMIIVKHFNERGQIFGEFSIVLQSWDKNEPTSSGRSRVWFPVWEFLTLFIDLLDTISPSNHVFIVL